MTQPINYKNVEAELKAFAPIMKVYQIEWNSDPRSGKRECFFHFTLQLTTEGDAQPMSHSGCLKINMDIEDPSYEALGENIARYIHTDLLEIKKENKIPFDKAQLKKLITWLEDNYPAIIIDPSETELAQKAREVEPLPPAYQKVFDKNKEQGRFIPPDHNGTEQLIGMGTTNLATALLAMEIRKAIVLGKMTEHDAQTFMFEFKHTDKKVRQKAVDYIQNIIDEMDNVPLTDEQQLKIEEIIIGDIIKRFEQEQEEGDHAPLTQPERWILKIFTSWIMERITSISKELGDNTPMILMLQNLTDPLDTWRGENKDCMESKNN